MIYIYIYDIYICDIYIYTYVYKYFLAIPMDFSIPPIPFAIGPWFPAPLWPPHPNALRGPGRWEMGPLSSGNWPVGHLAIGNLKIEILNFIGHLWQKMIQFLDF